MSTLQVLVICLAPSIAAGVLGWLMGEVYGYQRAGDHALNAMPQVSKPQASAAAHSLDDENEGDCGIFERARR